MNKIFVLPVCLLFFGCMMESTPVQKTTHTSWYDNPIDTTEMLCERLPVNNIISDNIYCMEARSGDRKGSFYKTYNDIVIIPSETLYLKEILTKKLENPNEIRDAAFKICTIRVFSTMRESLHKKSYCDCNADFVYKKLQNKKTVTGQDVVDLLTKNTSYKKDPLGVNIVHENCRDKLDRYMTYDNTYREFYDDCVKIQKESKDKCDENTKLLLEAFGITKTKGIYQSDMPSAESEEFGHRLEQVLKSSE